MIHCLKVDRFLEAFGITVEDILLKRKELDKAGLVPVTLRLPQLRVLNMEVKFNSDPRVRVPQVEYHAKTKRVDLNPEWPMDRSCSDELSGDTIDGSAV